MRTRATGVKLLELMAAAGKNASELAACMESYPQVLVNVKITADKKGMWSKTAAVTEAIAKVEQALGADGRILVRESGTEPLVRVMLEGKNTEEITAFANEVAALIEQM